MKRQYINHRPKNAIDVVNFIYGYAEGADGDENRGLWSDQAQEPTYWDKKCKNIAFDLRRYRSVDSLYSIAKGYFPRLNKDNFIKSIIDQEIYGFYGCGKLKTTTLCVANDGGLSINQYLPTSIENGEKFADMNFINKYL